jgi:hypothetical protein
MSRTLVFYSSLIAFHLSPMLVVDPTTQSMLSPDATWAGVMLLIIGGLFLGAITIGIVARLLSPERYDEPTHKAPEQD